MSFQRTLDNTYGLIPYGGANWTTISTADPTQIYGGTLAKCTGTGNFSFIFEDTAVFIYGSVYPMKPGVPTTPVSSVYIMNHKVVGSYTAPNVTQQLDHVVFWSADNLISTYHTVVVNVTSASLDHPFLFDFIAFPYAASTEPSVTLPLGPASSSSVDAASHSPTVQTATRHSNIATVIGGVVGGTALFALASIAALWIRYHRPTPRKLGPSETVFVNERGDALAGIPDVEPFLLPRDYNTTSADVIPAERAAPLALSVSGLRGAASVRKERCEHTQPPRAGASS